MSTDPNDGESYDDPWVPNAAIENLKMEREVNGDLESHEDLSRRMLSQNAPLVTASIIHLAIHGSTDRLRLDAGKYILDRVLGRPGDDVNSGSVSPLVDFVNEVTAFVEANDTSR